MQFADMNSEDIFIGLKSFGLSGLKDVYEHFQITVDRVIKKQPKF